MNARSDRRRVLFNYNYNYNYNYNLLQVLTVLPFKQHVLETAERPFPLVRLGLRVVKREESDA
eukprot:COSAG02_NODE_66_length_42609_cov_95.996848_32_plen_63_part_00